MAYWELTTDELEAFLKQIELAGIDLEEREKLYQALFDDLEQELTIIGATCVEDRL